MHAGASAVASRSPRRAGDESSKESDALAAARRRVADLEARCIGQAAAIEKLAKEGERLGAENALLSRQNRELRVLAGQADDGEVGGLRRRIAELEREVTELRAKLHEAVRAAKRTAAPHRRKNAKKRRKKPGRKQGHPGARRAVPDRIDATRSTTLADGCPECHHPALEDLRDYFNYAVDLPPIEPLYIKYEWQSGYCPKCRRRKQSRHPEQPSTAQGAAQVALGGHALALAMDLHIRHGVAYERIVEIYQRVFQFPITAGGIALAIQRVGARLLATYDALIEALRLADAVFVDETGWRVLRVTTWLWVFSSKDVTIYVVDARKGHEVPLRILGDGFVGVLHHDGARTYDSLPYLFHQTCLQHILRDLDELVEMKTRGSVRWPRAVADLLRQAIHLRKQRGVQPSGAEAKDHDAAGRVEAELDRLLVADLTDPDNVRMKKRLIRNRDALFAFLYLEEAEATNTEAERQVRPQVATRKNGACNRSWKGALANQIIGSIIATARQQKQNEFSILVEAATQPTGHLIERIIPARVQARAGPDPPASQRAA